MATKLGEKNGVTVTRVASIGQVMVRLAGPGGVVEYPLDELARLLRERAWKGDGAKCCNHACVTEAA